MKKILGILLPVSFLATLTVPLTGVIFHKLAATVLLLLGLVHVFTVRKRSKSGLGLLALMAVSFAAGILGMIFDRFPVVLGLHKLLSLFSIFALGVHAACFFRRKMERD